MHGPLSVTLADIYRIRMETDVVVPTRRMFYKRYDDDVCNCHLHDTSDKLYDDLNDNLITTIKPQSFLDTEIIHNGMKKTEFHHMKKTKLPTSRTSNIPKSYKWNTIKAEFYRAKPISSNFINEVTLIRNKIISAGQPMHLVHRFYVSLFYPKKMRTVNSPYHLGFPMLRRK